MGELGFWLMVGMVISAMIVSGALKERDREREKQATLRALLEKDGQGATEVLAYMRERDAEKKIEAAYVHATESRQYKKLGAVGIGLLAFVAGIFAFVAAGKLLNGWSYLLIPLSLGLGLWAAGLIVAVRMWRRANQANDPHPNA